MEDRGYCFLTGWINISSTEVEQSLTIVESGRKLVDSADFGKRLPQYNNTQYIIFLALEKQ